jgi:(2Fe-2S) ferredoxin
MGKELRVPEKVIYVCQGSTCKSRGSKGLRKLLTAKIKGSKLKGIEIIKTGCTDRCKFGPIFCLQPHNLWFLKVDENKLLEIFNKHIS